MEKWLLPSHYLLNLVCKGVEEKSTVVDDISVSNNSLSKVIFIFDIYMWVNWLFDFHHLDVCGFLGQLARLKTQTSDP